jgi:hypothetical protein
VSVDIEVVRSVTDELVLAFGRLLPQLSRSAEALDAEALHGLVDWPGNHLLVARVDGEIMGTLTLVRSPALVNKCRACRAWSRSSV